MFGIGTTELLILAGLCCVIPVVAGATVAVLVFVLNKKKGDPSKSGSGSDSHE